MRILAVLLLTLTAAMIAPPPASAKCIGPGISVSDGEVRRGETLRIAGEGWGDDCHDTGVPPDAHGILGDPLHDIEIAFVQNGKETVVARGSADDEYRFKALVAVPSTLRPGPVRLVARSGDVSAFERPTVTVSKTTPVRPERGGVQVFGGPRVSFAENEPGQSDDSMVGSWLLGGALGITLAAAVVLVNRRARRGVSEDEFTAFYAEHKDRCLRAVVASGMAPDRAEEAVAEAFARAWSRWSTVRKTAAPAAWVFRTAVNANISWWRKRRHEVVADRLPEGRFDAFSGSEGTVELLAAVRRLPPRQREVVVLRYLLDLDTAAAAAYLGIAQGTVRAHLHHAIAALRDQLTSTEGIPS